MSHSCKRDEDSSSDEEDIELVKTQCNHKATGDEHPAMRTSGSAALSLLQLVALVSFLAGGITILVLSKDRADGGKGEVPMYWYITSLGDHVHRFNMSPGYPLGAAMLFMFVMYTIDLLALYPNWYMWCVKKINPKSKLDAVELSKDTGGERRYDAARTTRRYLRMAPTWGILSLVLHLAVGEFQIPKLLLSTLVTAACLISLMSVMNASNTVHHFLSENKKSANDLLRGQSVEMYAQASTIGANTIWSGVFLFFSLLSLLIDWKYNRDDPGTFVTSRTDGAVMMFAVIISTYWFMALSAANVGLVSLQSYILQPTSFIFSVPGMLTQYVFNGKFIEEAVTTAVDMAFFGVISYLAFKDIIDSRATIPLP